MPTFTAVTPRNVHAGWVSRAGLERILMGDNDPSMHKFAAGATRGSVQGALVRVARGGRSAGWLPRLLVWRLWATQLPDI
eukprot:4565741-Prymnesium_polylepis.1